MTKAGTPLVDVGFTRYYHWISRCLRHAFLCGQRIEHRKQSIEDRIERATAAPE